MPISINSGGAYAPDTYRIKGSTPSEAPFRASGAPVESDRASGIHVDLSHLGRGLSSGAGGATSSREARLEKIDKSSFSDELKEIMKRIVELRDALEKKQQALQQVMQNQSLSVDQRQQQASALQSDISNLSSALQAAMGMLTDAMQQEGLEAEQAVEIATLVL